MLTGLLWAISTVFPPGEFLFLLLFGLATRAKTGEFQARSGIASARLARQNFDHAMAGTVTTSGTVSARELPPRKPVWRRPRTALGNPKDDVQNGDPRKAHSALNRFFVALSRRRSRTDFHPSKLTKLPKFPSSTGHFPYPDRTTLAGTLPFRKSHSQCKNVRQTMPHRSLLLARVFFSRSLCCERRPGLWCCAMATPPRRRFFLLRAPPSQPIRKRTVPRIFSNCDG